VWSSRVHNPTINWDLEGLEVSMAAKQLIEKLEQGLRALFVEIRDDGNSNPVERFRLEGIIAAAEIAEILAREQIYIKMEQCYLEVNRRTLGQTFGDNWVGLYPFPSIPVRGVRAPVYPSGKK